MRRVRIRQEVGATFVAGASRGEGRLHDVSPNGFFMNSPTLLRRGSRVSVVFRTPGGGLSVAEGEVRWNTARAAGQLALSGFGVRVTRSDDGFRRLVDAALSSDGHATRSVLI
jgi:hypothetical protein